MKIMGNIHKLFLFFIHELLFYLFIFINYALTVINIKIFPLAIKYDNLTYVDITSISCIIFIIFTIYEYT